MSNPYEGMASSGVLSADGMRKTSFRQFSEADAHEYIRDAQAYDKALVNDGYTLPDIYGYSVEPSGNGRFVAVQHSEFISGHDMANPQLAPERKHEAAKEVVATISRAAIDHSGVLLAPIDAKPDNFVVNSDGKVFFVDTLPPMVKADSGRFPYEYIEGVGNPIKKSWTDRYVRSQAGVLTRLVANVIQDEKGTKEFLRHGSLEADIAELFSDIDTRANRRLVGDVKSSMVPFLAHTAFRRIVDRHS